MEKIRALTKEDLGEDVLEIKCYGYTATFDKNGEIVHMKHGDREVWLDHGIIIQVLDPSSEKCMIIRYDKDTRKAIYTEDASGERAWYEYHPNGHVSKVILEDGTQVIFNEAGIATELLNKNGDSTSIAPNGDTNFILNDSGELIM
jgi:hypothetical protein